MGKGLSIILGFMMAFPAWSHEGHGDAEHSAFNWADLLENDDMELEGHGQVLPFACSSASNAQIAEINRGNAKKEAFLARCASATSSSPWCQQLVRPNPSSIATFRCTYGSSQTHQLIHPDEGTWNYAYGAVKLIEELEASGIRVSQIYNWWRPEPYNRNVGGAAGRHPFGTSVDVRFASKTDQEKAFRKLCGFRKAGRMRAIGYYSSTSLHFGMGDRTPNTWGKSCP